MSIADFLKGDPVAWDTILRVIAEEMDCVAGTLHRMRDAGTLKLVAYRNIPDHLLNAIREIPVGKGIAGVAAARRVPVEICNLQEDDGGGVARPAARETHVAGSVAVPIIWEGELRGALGVGKSVPHVFTEDEKRKLAGFAELIGARLG